MPVHDLDDPMCAALPVAVSSVSWTWCSAHQTYTIHGSIIHQTTDDVEVLESRHIPLGPFDGREELVTIVRRLVEDLLPS